MLDDNKHIKQHRNIVKSRVNFSYKTIKQKTVFFNLTSYLVKLALNRFNTPYLNKIFLSFI